MKYKIAVNIILTLLLFSTTIMSYGRNIIEKFEPKFWYTNLKYSNILIAAKGENISQSFIKINYPNVKFNKLIYTNTPNICFIDITIKEQVEAGFIPIMIYQRGKLQQTIDFEIKKRNTYIPTSISTSDAIYQIIIDRFCNGNTYNDKIDSYIEAPNRIDPSGIHGGDISGIDKNLTYIKNMGFNSIDLSPINESNQLSHSFYHDRITCHYEIDKRLGTLNEIQSFSKSCKENKIKYIQSFTLHKGSIYHWLLSPFNIKDLALHSEEITFNQHEMSLQIDPYATKQDINNQIISNLDFNDVFYNQDLEVVQSYLIQNVIWWIETIRPDAIKIEDANLNKLSFLNNLVENIKSEYPNFQVFTDYNSNSSSELAFYKKAIEKASHSLVYDYPLANCLSDCFSEFTNPNTGVLNIQSQLGQDFVYDQTDNNILFIDNTHTTRAFTFAEKNLSQLKMLYTFIFTNRGIPCMLYGTEVLLDGNILKGINIPRKDFPGGWVNDNSNAFKNLNLTYEQSSFQEFIKKLALYRAKTEVIIKGVTKHTTPDEGIYMQHKSLEKKDVIIIYNNNSTFAKVNIPYSFPELTAYSKAKNPISNNEFEDIKNILIDAKTALILELE